VTLLSYFKVAVTDRECGLEDCNDAASEESVQSNKRRRKYSKEFDR
jgi:hypothetical protein